MASASSSRRPTKLSRFLQALRLPRTQSNTPTTTQTTISSSAGGAAVCFQLSPSCVLKLQMGDVTKWSVDGSTDAIVNSTNVRMLGGGGVDGGFQLPASHVTHTVGPVYNTDKEPAVSLKNAHINCLQLAKENNIQHIAFGAISCGVFGYPYKEASRIDISTVKEFANEFKEVHFVFLQDDHYSVWLETAREQL